MYEARNHHRFQSRMSLSWDAGHEGYGIDGNLQGLRFLSLWRIVYFNSPGPSSAFMSLAALVSFTCRRPQYLPNEICSRVTKN
jgi:hypothetical protein